MASIDLPLTYLPSPSFSTFAFRSSEGRLLLLELDPYGGTDPMGIFPIFLKRTTDVLTPSLSVVFRLAHVGSFPVYWIQANASPIPKGPPSSSVANYRPFSITSLLSVFERGVGSSQTIYGTQWCASKLSVLLSKKYWYL